MADFYISPGTRAKYRPSSDAMNISMDFNASPNGGARGTEVIIPNNSSPSVRAAAEKYNQLVAGFANKYGITGYPVRGVRTRAENKRGVANTIHAEPFFNDDEAMQRAVQENPAEFAELYRSAFGGLDNARLIAPHGVGKDRGASSAFFGDETSYGELMANSLLGQAPQPTTSTQGAAPMMQQKEKPRGLLGSLGIQKMEEGAEGETGQRFYQRDSFKDTAAILAQGFGRMGIMGMEEIADSVAKQRTENKARNKTLEMLGKMGTPQANSAIEYIKAGGAATDAMKIAFAKPAKATAKEDEIARLKSIGFSEDVAIRIADNVLELSTHPITGVPTLVDKAELLAQQAVLPATGEPVQPADAEAGKNEELGADIFANKNARQALGAVGFGAKIGNVLFDTFGLTPKMGSISEAQNALEFLSTETTLGLAASFPGRPSNLVREEIRNLTVKPADILAGPDKALGKSAVLVKKLDEYIADMQEIVGGEFSPEDRSKARLSIQTLQPIREGYASLNARLREQLEPNSKGGGTALRPEVSEALGRYTR